MQKPSDDAALPGKEETKVLNEGDQLGDTKTGIATTEDFRKDWEKRGKPTRALESIFEIDKQLSWINRNYSQSLAAMDGLKDVEHLSRLVSMSVGLLPTTSLDFIVTEQAHALKALEEITGASTSLDSVLKTQAPFLEATKVSEELSRAIFNSCSLPLLQDMTEALSLSAISCIRASSPLLPHPVARPSQMQSKPIAPKPQPPKGSTTVTPREKEMRLLDVAAQALSQLDAAQKAQTAIVRSSKEWDMLNQMRSLGQTADLSRWLRKRADEVIKSCKQRLQFRVGRKRKLDTEKDGYKFALQVEAALPDFEKAFLEKKRLKTKYRNRDSKIKSELARIGYLPQQIECLMKSRTPLSAACHYIAGSSATNLEVQTVQNYYSRFRNLISRDRPSQKADGPG